MTDPVTLQAISGIPLVQPDDDLSAIILDALAESDVTLQDDDILVISSKIVSKAEGRLVDLRHIEPDEHARQVAQETGKDARIVMLVLQESTAISRKARGVLVTQHRLGFVSANAGIDQSNVGDDEHHVLLLPEAPDRSATMLRTQISQSTGASIGVIISDSHGRPFRMGNVGVALGVAGLPALRDLRGQKDLYGRQLRISLQAYGDLLASAAHLVSGEGDEGRPVVLIRGLHFTEPAGHGADLNRPARDDLYR